MPNKILGQLGCVPGARDVAVHRHPRAFGTVGNRLMVPVLPRVA
jgi:hypothetical protein